jgi:hypothetical protein
MKTASIDSISKILKSAIFHFYGEKSIPYESPCNFRKNEDIKKLGSRKKGFTRPGPGKFGDPDFLKFKIILSGSRFGDA